MIKKIYGCAYAKLCVFYNNVRSTSNGVLRQAQQPPAIQTALAIQPLELSNFKL